MMSEGQYAGVPDRAQPNRSATVLGAMQTETGLLLAGLAYDAPLAAAVHAAEAPPGALLRFDRPEQGGLLFVDEVAPGDEGLRFVAWLPAAFVQDVPSSQLRMVARTGRAEVLAIHPESYRTFAAYKLPGLYPRFAPLIDNMVDMTQPPGHPLRAVMRMLAEELAGELARQAARSTATGAFDFIADDVAHGWAWDTRMAGTRQLVEILEGDAVVARGHAEYYRADLAPAGIGDGHHHFRIVLPLSLRDGAPHRLSARLPDGGVELAGGPHAYRSAPNSLAFFDMMPAAATFERACRLQSGDAVVAALQLHALVDNDQPDAAREAALALLAKDGDSGVACVKLGEALLLLQRDADAAAAYRRARAADALCAYALLGLGNSHARRAEWTAAEDAYRAGLALDGACAPLAARLEQVRPRAFRQRMRALIQAGNADVAVTALTDHLFADPADREAFALLEDALDVHAGHGPASVSTAARRLRAFQGLIEEAANRRESSRA